MGARSVRRREMRAQTDTGGQARLPGCRGVSMTALKAPEAPRTLVEIAVVNVGGLTQLSFLADRIGRVRQTRQLVPQQRAPEPLVPVHIRMVLFEPVEKLLELRHIQAGRYAALFAMTFEQAHFLLLHQGSLVPLTA
ncbi:hypothetical protein BURKHO8Y_120221 [Burkholderia sp. 8Y]|nr:hypothetical protein BURKHO8Y_120221 [Burkholderia sp. 8Y]